MLCAQRWTSEHLNKYKNHSEKVLKSINPTGYLDLYVVVEQEMDSKFKSGKFQTIKLPNI